MPKVNIGDVNIFYRVFHDGGEIRLEDEDTYSGSYLDEKGVEVKVEKPLRVVADMNITTNDADCFDSDLPTLVMLPGGPGFIDHSLYLDFWAKLSDMIQVVILDQRGNGRSDRGDPALWNMDQCADDVVAFCEKLNISKPLVAGVSWGGYVGMHYAAKYPERPGALILMHTETQVRCDLRQAAFTKRAEALRCTAEQIKAVQEAVDAYDHTPNKPGVREFFLKNCWGTFYGKNPYQPEDFAQCVTNIPMREKFAAEENLQFDFRGELQDITCPVWWVAGENDPSHPYQGAEDGVKRIKNARLNVLKGLGAPVYRDEPEKMLQMTREVIKDMLPRLLPCASVARRKL